MIYDNWHTATCMKYHPVDSTNSLKNLAHKNSHMILKRINTSLSTDRCFPNWCHPMTSLGAPLQWGRVVALIKFRYQFFYPMCIDSCIVWVFASMSSLSISITLECLWLSSWAKWSTSSLNHLSALSTGLWYLISEAVFCWYVSPCYCVSGLGDCYLVTSSTIVSRAILNYHSMHPFCHLPSALLQLILQA